MRRYLSCNKEGFITIRKGSYLFDYLFPGTLAIGITANFINHNDEVEKNVEEISGIAYHFNPKFFDDLRSHKNIRLENIVYYKDETHYFVMTALKSSLLQRGVLKQVRLLSLLPRGPWERKRNARGDRREGN